MRPIIFSTDMVKAILEGRKTQTRRVIKPQPKINSQFYWYGKRSCVWPTVEYALEEMPMFCPYGKVGDRLWVRETWHKDKNRVIRYKADYTLGADKWKSPRYMPRDASRITLEINDIRVERLQEIDKRDEHNQHIDGGAWAEGIRCINPTAGFMILWNSLHKKQHSWKNNPWVWVISFKKTKGGMS